MEGERNDGGTRLRMFGGVLRFKRIFERAEADIHLSADDLFLRGLCETQLADCQASVCIVRVVADRRPKGAAEDGSRGVKIACVRHGIEEWAGISVRPLLKEFDRLLVSTQDPRDKVAGEERSEMLPANGEARSNACPKPEGCKIETFPKTVCIKRGDLEDAMATL